MNPPDRRQAREAPSPSQQKDFDIKFDLDPLPLIGQPLILPFLLHLTLDPVHHQINIYFNMNFI